MSSPSTKTTILITGGNNGIGLATCQVFAQQPNYHIFMGSRSLEKGQQAASSISPHKDTTISVIQLDISSDTSITSAVNSVTSTLSSQGLKALDILVNNAGICPETFTRTIVQECIDTNAISPALVTAAFAPLLLQAKTPRVIYVSSVLGSISTRTNASGQSYHADFKAYRMSKAALDMVVACDAWEYREHKNLKVFAFCPGYVITDLAGHRKMKEEQGVAKSPMGSARGILAIAQGGRDGESGRFVYGEGGGDGGVYPW